MEIMLGILVGALYLALPILVIVSLVKLTEVQRSVAEIREKLASLGAERKNPRLQLRPVPESRSDPAPQSAVVSAVVVPPKPEPVPEPKPAPEPLPTPMRPAPEPTYLETALEVFWGKVEDWFAVRGDFAPKGMSREFAFATRWLVRLGVLLIVGSLIYFVKLSIDRGWMGPTGRVIGTVFWGAVGVAAGAELVKRTQYGIIGQAVAALGVFALYLGFGLGHRYFDPPVIASPVFAFAALAAVTFFAGAFATLLPSAPIAVMALIGGYLVPVLAGRDTGSPLGLCLYLLVLNLGASVVARRRAWSALDFLAGTLAYVMAFLWCGRHAHLGTESLLVMLGFLSVVHALYVTGVIRGSKTRGKVGNSLAWAGLAINACTYFAWICLHFRAGTSSAWTGILVLGLVAFYLALATLSLKRGWADRTAVDIMLFFAVTFLAVAPLFLFDYSWCPLCWCAIAVAVSEAGAKVKERLLTGLGLAILALAGAVAIFHGALSTNGYAWECGGFAAGSAAVTAGGWFAAFVLRVLRLWSLPVACVIIGRRTAKGPLLISAGIIAFFFYTFEAHLFGRTFLPGLRSGTITIAWAALAFAGIWAGLVRRLAALRVCALVLFAVVVAKVLLVDTGHLATAARVGVCAFTGVVLIVGAFLYIRSRERFVNHD